MGLFDESFPIISEVIDTELSNNNSIDRDTLISKLLEHSKVQKILPILLNKNTKHNTPKSAIGNLVDWFSAEITKKSKASIPYLNKYTRRRVKKNGRAVWEYRFNDNFFTNEITEENATKLVEGSIKQIKVNAYERNPKARIACLTYHGFACCCCGFDFNKIYGEIGSEFIHVHHLKLISEIKKEYCVNPIEDLRPVCPNCHAMIHRKNPPFTIEEIKKILKNKNTK